MVSEWCYDGVKMVLDWYEARFGGMGVLHQRRLCCKNTECYIVMIKGFRILCQKGVRMVLKWCQNGVRAVWMHGKAASRTRVCVCASMCVCVCVCVYVCLCEFV
jgi:hypothetical protein